VAAGVAFWSFSQVGLTMRELVENRFPVVEVSFELADAAASSVAIAPRLADAESMKALDEQMGLLSDADQRMRQQLDKLPTTATRDSAEIAAQIDRLASGVKETYRTARERLILISETRQRVAEFVKAQEQLTQLFLTMTDETLFDLTLGMETAGSEFQRAVGTISTLDDAASRIDEVIGLIQTIAGRTNLLALNAKIEARAPARPARASRSSPKRSSRSPDRRRKRPRT